MKKVTYGIRPSAGKLAGKELIYHGTPEQRDEFIRNCSNAVAYCILHPDEEIPSGSLREVVLNPFILMNEDHLTEVNGVEGLIKMHEQFIREQLQKTQQQQQPTTKTKTPTEKQVSRLFAMCKTLQDKVAELEKKIGQF